MVIMMDKRNDYKEIPKECLSDSIDCEESDIE